MQQFWWKCIFIIYIKAWINFLEYNLTILPRYNIYATIEQHKFLKEKQGWENERDINRRNNKETYIIQMH